MMSRRKVSYHCKFTECRLLQPSVQKECRFAATLSEKECRFAATLSEKECRIAATVSIYRSDPEPNPSVYSV